MNVSRLLTSSLAALAIVGGVGWVYAQSTATPATEAQPPITTPADTAATPAPDATTPGATMNDPVARADRN